MKVFISWSGDRSKKLAEFLAGWLRKLPLTIVPWVSKEAIDPGTRWGKELAEALEGTKFGILCITPENQKEPWVNFEAGALSKTIEKTFVVPYLIGMAPSQLEQPLKQFQAIEANEEDTWKLIETIYTASGDKTRTINDLKDTFKVWWPTLSEQIKNVKEEIVDSNIISYEPTIGEIKFMLDKALTVLESLSSRFTKMESETFSLETGIVRAHVRQSQRRIRDEFIALRDNVSLRDIAIEKQILDLANDPQIRDKMIMILNTMPKERLEQSSFDENNESKE